MMCQTSRELGIHRMRTKYLDASPCTSHSNGRMEGSFGTQKEHYGLKRINGRIKKTEILIIFFGIHTANAVQLARRIAKEELSRAA